MGNEFLVKYSLNTRNQAYPDGIDIFLNLKILAKYTQH